MNLGMRLEMYDMGLLLLYNLTIYEVCFEGAKLSRKIAIFSKDGQSFCLFLIHKG